MRHFRRMPNVARAFAGSPLLGTCSQGEGQELLVCLLLVPTMLGTPHVPGVCQQCSSALSALSAPAALPESSAQEARMRLTQPGSPDAAV